MSDLQCIFFRWVVLVNSYKPKVMTFNKLGFSIPHPEAVPNSQTISMPGVEYCQDKSCDIIPANTTSTVVPIRSKDYLQIDSICQNHTTFVEEALNEMVKCVTYHSMPPNTTICTSCRVSYLKMVATYDRLMHAINENGIPCRQQLNYGNRNGQTAITPFEKMYDQFTNSDSPYRQAGCTSKLLLLMATLS